MPPVRFEPTIAADHKYKEVQAPVYQSEKFNTKYWDIQSVKTI